MRPSPAPAARPRRGVRPFLSAGPSRRPGEPLGLAAPPTGPSGPRPCFRPPPAPPPHSGLPGRRSGARRTESALRPWSRRKGLCGSPIPGPIPLSFGRQGPAPPLTRARGGCHLASLSLEGRPLLHPPPVLGPFCAGVRAGAGAIADDRHRPRDSMRGRFFPTLLEKGNNCLRQTSAIRKSLRSWVRRRY